MRSTPASPQGRAGLITSNGNVNQSPVQHPWSVSDPERKLSSFADGLGMRADLLQKSNLIARGKSASPISICSYHFLRITLKPSYMGVFFLYGCSGLPPPGVYH